jgi:hypothetical protein
MKMIALMRMIEFNVDIGDTENDDDDNNDDIHNQYF